MLQLYAAVWRVSGPRQIILIILAVLIAVMAAVPLKFQQEIVNLLTDDKIDRGRLALLCAGMMAAILVSLGLKFVMGYRSGILGEDVIRLVRSRLLRAVNTPGHKEVPSGTLSTAISAEAEEVGKFAGGAFSDPVMQVGSLISVIGFVAANQPKLGLIALLMIVPQVIAVLYSQTKVNILVADRVHVLRGATNKVTSPETRQDEDPILEDFDRIYDIRRGMFVWKLSAKFVISAVNGAGTVLVLLFGGWLVLEGKSDVGIVVAATLGLTRIQGPTTFLIAFYRQVSANRVKFDLLRGLIVAEDQKDLKAAF